jgi:FkbM family methyltransferase
MQHAGNWEPEEGRLLCALIRPGERFLDIGANVGYFSVLVGKAAPGVSVDAVEPDPDNVSALEFNLWVNQVHAKVWPVALDSSDRSLVLSGNETNFGDLRCGRISPRRDNGSAIDHGDEVDDGYKWIVPAASGDELFAGRGFDVIKIDVQGWEFEVLSGLTAVLDRSPNVRIVVEFQPGILRSHHREPKDVLALYRKNGYRIRCQLGDDLLERSDNQIVELCDTAGSIGSINLLLER